MGSSRNSSSGELPERAAAVLAPAIFPGAHLALGLSGGVDSVALLSALTELAPAMRFSLRAVHINHGISPNAARWAGFCARLCAGLQIPLQLETVDIGPYRNLGLEGAARQARYEAFARVDADFIVLAQHRDDQAETLLLHLLRGAGLRGLEWVEDESNVDTLRQRNFLRHEVFPLIERQFPAVRATVARTAAHLAEARELLDEVARGDFERCGGGTAVDIPVLHRLGEARTKNVLRHWCETRGIEPLSAARTAELLRQLKESRADARFSFAVPGWTFLRYREKLYLRRASETLERNLREVWDGGNALPMLSLGGVLKFKPEEGRGLSVAKLRAD